MAVMAGRGTRNGSQSGLCASLCVPTLGGAALPVAAEALAIAPADEPILPIPRRLSSILPRFGSASACFATAPGPFQM